MGHVFDFNDAKDYQRWLNSPNRHFAAELESRLMIDMLKPLPGETLLDIGCGTGASLKPFLDFGLQVTGIDPSPYMLDIAAQRLGHRVDLHRGTAEELPFEDNAFDCALFFTSLEFTQRPAKAIEEACRVAKDTVIICVLNRYAPLNMGRRLKGFFIPDIYNQAHFFSIWELKQILYAILGKVPVKWRTTLQFPFTYGSMAGWVENRRLVQRSCFGSLIGMRIKPVPKFRSRPLVLKLKKPKSYKPATGWTRMGP